MCGRYEAPIELEFTLVRQEWQFSPSHNVAPTQDVPIVRVNKAAERAGLRVHWGPDSRLMPIFPAVRLRD